MPGTFFLASFSFIHSICWISVADSPEMRSKLLTACIIPALVGGAVLWKNSQPIDAEMANRLRASTVWAIKVMPFLLSDSDELGSQMTAMKDDPIDITIAFNKALKKRAVLSSWSDKFVNGEYVYSGFALKKLTVQRVAEEFKFIALMRHPELGDLEVETTFKMDIAGETELGKENLRGKQ